MAFSWVSAASAGSAVAVKRDGQGVEDHRILVARQLVGAAAASSASFDDPGIGIDFRFRSISGKKAVQGLRVVVVRLFSDFIGRASRRRRSRRSGRGNRA